jgi:hypothetical protein
MMNSWKNYVLDGTLSSTERTDDNKVTWLQGNQRSLGEASNIISMQEQGDNNTVQSWALTKF